ncbi:SDR family oxidoreductase [Lentzea albidocapillata]|uniref:Short chain dehydrogenase n=1 Tax=Lentzea albidocapillata TaxID=40571 RepID=A0A1W2F8Q7_9PSEU|nr:SDR family oxidoreductase [Lentzea albidocapillata]SMD18329.1 short chain dehydrogenase [Lentzea albidocapillata]
MTGASRGIGLATAGHLRNSCEQLILVGHTKGPTTPVTGTGAAAATYQVDLRSPDERQRFREQLAAREGPPITGFVHCAGGGMPAAVEDIDGQVLRDLFELHVVAFVELARDLLPAMRRSEFGRIVAVGSLAPLRPRSFMIPYAATKAALRAAVQCLAAEVIGDSVLVNCVSPGGVDTDLGRAGRERLVRLFERQGRPSPPPRQEDLPRGRAVEAADVARAIAFLLDPENEVLAGQDLVVAGTHLMR